MKAVPMRWFTVKPSPGGFLVRRGSVLKEPFLYSRASKNSTYIFQVPHIMCRNQFLHGNKISGQKLFQDVAVPLQAKKIWEVQRPNE